MCNSNDFGKRLKKLRTQKGLSLDELSKKFNVNKTSFSNYENGVHYPKVKLLIEIANFFDVSIDFILARTDIESVDKVIEDYTFLSDLNKYSY